MGYCSSHDIIIKCPPWLNIWPTPFPEWIPSTQSHALIPSTCFLQTTDWSPCSATCGMGVSSRVTNSNAECRLARETQLCQIRECDLPLIPSLKVRHSSINWPLFMIPLDICGDEMNLFVWYLSPTEREKMSANGTPPHTSAHKLCRMLHGAAISSPLLWLLRWWTMLHAFSDTHSAPTLPLPWRAPGLHPQHDVDPALPLHWELPWRRASFSGLAQSA